MSVAGRPDLVDASKLLTSTITIGITGEVVADNRSDVSGGWRR